MKYAVIEAGGKQHLVTKDQELQVELVGDKKTLSFEPLLVFDEKTAQVGTPKVSGMSVKAEVVEPKVAGDKVKIMKFKAKKRVKKQTGHRQKYSKIKITAIGT
jgi:large subunit ribosomal protein L21